MSTSLSLGPRFAGARLLSADGVAANAEFRVAPGVTVFELGCTEVEVAGTLIHASGAAIIRPSARQLWQLTLLSIDHLWRNDTSIDFMHEVALARSTLTSLLSGLEAYARTRFVEVESEGASPDVARLISKFVRQKYRADTLGACQEASVRSGRTILAEFMATRSINFQSYKDLSRAYAACYGLHLRELGVSHSRINELVRFIDCRHTIVHVDPVVVVLNLARVPPEEPVFCNRATAIRAREVYSLFVSALHTATLALRPSSSSGQCDSDDAD